MLSTKLCGAHVGSRFYAGRPMLLALPRLRHIRARFRRSLLSSPRHAHFLFCFGRMTISTRSFTTIRQIDQSYVLRAPVGDAFDLPRECIGFTQAICYDLHVDHQTAARQFAGYARIERVLTIGDRPGPLASTFANIEAHVLIGPPM